MKKLLFLSLLFISFFSKAQWNPSGARVRFVPGIAIGTRDTSWYSAATDTSIIVMGKDSTLWYKYKGFFKPLGGAGSLSSLTFGSGLNSGSYNGSSAQTAKVDTSTISTKANVTALLTGYASGASVVKYTDTAAMLGNYYNKTATDSRLALKLNISDTASMLSTHPNTTLVNSQLALKLDKSDSTIANRVTAERTFVNAALALKVNYTDTASMLSTHPNTTLVNSLNALNVKYTDTATMLLPYSRDFNVVHKTGNETIAGVKTFSSDATINNLTVGLGGGNDSRNTVLGNQAGLANNSGVAFNTFIGYQSGLINTTSNANTFIGYQSGVSSLTGGSNTALGYSSAYGLSVGMKNIFLGANSGRYISGGVTLNSLSDNSIYLGYDTRALANNQTNQIVIGYNETGLGSNTTILGNSSTVQTALRGRLTLGSTVDDGSNQLQVTGSSKFTGAIVGTSTLTLSGLLNNSANEGRIGILAAGGGSANLSYALTVGGGNGIVIQGGQLIQK